VKIDGEHSVVPPIGRKAGGPEPELTEARRPRRLDDAVEISDRGKAAARRTGRPGIADAAGGMNSTINQVRTQLQERTRSGFYDSDEVLLGVAGKILDLFGL
jgi:hypothetical protein